jgi:hypothetical protein
MCECRIFARFGRWEDANPDIPMLLVSGRALRSLQKILASHALIHTTEGEFFRKAVREVCEHCRIPVVGIRERELGEPANATFGEAAARVRQHSSNLGKTVGAPWTQDEKDGCARGIDRIRNQSRKSYPVTVEDRPAGCFSGASAIRTAPMAARTAEATSRSRR